MFLQRTELRAVGDNRPFTGGTDPSLTAWMRLIDTDGPLDRAGLIVLLDALAPSVTATLVQLAAAPSVELSVRPTNLSPLSPGAAQRADEWVLVHATTTSVTPGGWIHEHINAWDRFGNHLAASDQLRLFQLIPNA